ncbi:response regulator transcription factor [Streptomyces sp. NPDC093261]|uniref:response regulator transcription factor n=1 Tax=Streptomyces sp. NPDC093261 TaxID=3366037 RepID=UPI0037FAB2ED
MLVQTPTETLLGQLTGRERQVLELVAEGKSNLAIGRQLRLRPKTVEAHLRSLFYKLGLEQSPYEHRRVMAAVTYLGRRPAT